MSKLSIINHQDQNDNLDIINISWSDYSNIMISLNNMIYQLEKNIDDNHLDSHRKQLLKKYEDLFQKMKSDNVPWRGESETLDDNVIDSTRKL